MGSISTITYTSELILCFTNPDSPGQSSMMKLSLQFSSLSFNTQCLSCTTLKKKSPSRPMPVTKALEQSAFKVHNQYGFCLYNSLSYREELCNHRERVSGNSLRLYKIQSIPSTQGEDNCRNRSQASWTNFNEVSPVSSLPSSKDASQAAAIQPVSQLQTWLLDFLGWSLI